MRLLRNTIWFVFAGLWLAIAWLLVSFGLCLTVVGIPFAFQALKIAGFVLFPFDHALVKTPDSGLREVNAVGNFIWVVLAGWWLALLHLVAGLVLMVTIIGLPFGMGLLKMIPITFAPFGRETVSASDPAAADAAEMFRLPAHPQFRNPRPAH